MRRAELGDLAAFVAVADGLSFRTAAERLGVTPSALSHTIRQVEERHGVRLLNRTTRKVSLTDAGDRLLSRLRPALDEISGAVEDLDRDRQRPFGRLAIVSVLTAASAVILPVWARYLAAYPDVQLDLRLDANPHDIVAEGFDAAIGPIERAAADMVAVRVGGPIRGVFVASPAYIARRGAPRAPQDLTRHDCIRLRGADGTIVAWWAEQKGRSLKLDIEGQLIVNDVALVLQAAADGLGIAMTGDRTAEAYLRDGRLVRVLESSGPQFEGMFLYYPPNRHVSPALRAFIDMIRPGAG
jgi:DNA-binding transcriptional LysR family regulator